LPDHSHFCEIFWFVMPWMILSQKWNWWSLQTGNCEDTGWQNKRYLFPNNCNSTRPEFNLIRIESSGNWVNRIISSFQIIHWTVVKKMNQRSKRHIRTYIFHS
jgi:hypothetical protein